MSDAQFEYWVPDIQIPHCDYEGCQNVAQNRLRIGAWFLPIYACTVHYTGSYAEELTNWIAINWLRKS